MVVAIPLNVSWGLVSRVVWVSLELFPWVLIHSLLVLFSWVLSPSMLVVLAVLLVWSLLVPGYLQRFLLGDLRSCGPLNVRIGLVSRDHLYVLALLLFFVHEVRYIFSKLLAIVELGWFGYLPVGVESLDFTKLKPDL